MHSLVTSKIRENSCLDKDDDKFGYYNLAKHLLEYILSKEFPISVGIYGKWGSGKSVLAQYMEIWAKESKKEIEFIKFDAVEFKNKGDSIFWFMIGNLINHLKIDSKAIKTALKIGKEFASSEKPPKIKMVSNLIEEIFPQEKIVNSIFSKLIKDEGGKKYIVIIDNLDRLLPSETITFLEQLKTYFLSNSKFQSDKFAYLILCDFSILEQEVFEIYKNKNLDVRDYLNKLIEVPFYLPVPENVHLNELVKNLLVQELPDEKKDLISAIFGNAELETPRDIKNFLLELDMIFIIAKARGHDEEYIIKNLEKILALQILKAKYLRFFNYLKKRRGDIKNVTREYLLEKVYQFTYANQPYKSTEMLKSSKNVEIEKFLDEGSIVWNIMSSSRILTTSKESTFPKMSDIIADIERLLYVVDSATENISVKIEEKIGIGSDYKVVN